MNGTKKGKKNQNNDISTEKLNFTGINTQYLSFKNEIDENKIFVISDKTFDELENIRMELINNCQFKLAQTVALQQRKQKEKEETDTASKYASFFSYLSDQAQDTYKEHLDKIYEKYETAEMKIRRNVSDQFHRLQIAHILALVESEKEFIIRNTKRTMKPPKPARELIHQANQTAKIGQYLNAQELVDLATEIDENARIEAKSEITREFMHVRKAMLKAQKTEITKLSDQLESKLGLMNQQMKDEIARLNVTYVKELGCAQTTAKKNAIKNAENQKIRNQALEMITQEYKQRIENIEQLSNETKI